MTTTTTNQLKCINCTFIAVFLSSKSTIFIWGALLSFFINSVFYLGCYLSTMSQDCRKLAFTFHLMIISIIQPSKATWRTSHLTYPTIYNIAWKVFTTLTNIMNLIHTIFNDTVNHTHRLWGKQNNVEQ